jgi:hypothetical protein
MNLCLKDGVGTGENIAAKNGINIIKKFIKRCTAIGALNVGYPLKVNITKGLGKNSPSKIGLYCHHHN